MRIHYLQHVPFESIENIGVWAGEREYGITGTLVYENADFPSLLEFDMLVILGGPMSVHDEASYPWLVQEKQFIKEAIQQQKLVLGICLGAQLIAEVIGGKVYKNENKEIGWFPVKLTEDAKHSPLFKYIPDEFIPFHWHGETFELPEEAKKMAFSKGCVNQAFVYDDHVIGLQFHLESSDVSITKLIENCADELEEGTYVQAPHEMLAQPRLLILSNAVLFTLLDAFESNKRHT
ncbi:type 1 glutamine amidotransferase [Paenibacillus sp. SC116]|uniref:type 1 glutamine amidotransferase n=1 Tax=Paenibacillus sp. SC116 TaxID=2968986 RepID=UPI00215A78E3|nr:type 1 glutamine amidotransferase [Paenibacillus sp. SC116]MCR8842321.1 type 1 glutamine amidotransferase [Paenibacillus sp. SC116]